MKTQDEWDEEARVAGNLAFRRVWYQSPAGLVWALHLPEENADALFESERYHAIA